MKKAIIIAFIAFSLPFTALAYSPQEIVNATNSYRTERHIPALKVNSTLQVVAQFIANDMAKRGYWSHVSPEGIKPFFWLDAIGYKYIYAGQNLAKNFTDTESTMKMWINSPKHKENLDNSHFEEVGVGMAKAGDGTVYVVQYFGSKIKDKM